MSDSSAMSSRIICEASSTWIPAFTCVASERRWNVWSGLFVMAPAVGQSLAAWTNRPKFRLIDLWDCAYIVGNARPKMILVEESFSSIAAAAAPQLSRLVTGGDTDTFATWRDGQKDEEDVEEHQPQRDARRDARDAAHYFAPLSG